VAEGNNYEANQQSWELKDWYQGLKGADWAYSNGESFQGI